MVVWLFKSQVFVRVLNACWDEVVEEDEDWLDIANAIRDPVDIRVRRGVWHPIYLQSQYNLAGETFQALIDRF